MEKKETIFQLMKHLGSWDIQAHARGTDDHYEIPMSTFWIPLNMHENIETDYTKEKFKMDFVDEVVNGKIKQAIKQQIKMNVTDQEFLAKQGFEQGTWLKIDDGTKFDSHLCFDKLDPPAEKDGKFKLKQMEERLTTSLRQI